MTSYCDFAPGRPIHGPYHDREYGFPQTLESDLFERLVLEINQAGLSWLTILKKRENYRKAFHSFDCERIARYTDADVARLLADAGIVRNRLKIASAIRNARSVLAIQEAYGSLAAYLWRYVDGVPRQNTWGSMTEIPARTELSDAMSRDLKKRGFKFVGSTICYAFMQAVGMVNDHTTDCYRHQEIRALAQPGSPQGG